VADFYGQLKKFGLPRQHENHGKGLETIVAGLGGHCLNVLSSMISRL
jgi:hypothetical protein